MPLALSILFVALGLAEAPSLAAQTEDDALLGMSLEELLQVQVSTASIDLTPWTRQPATLTVLTREELIALGARDLMGALEFVPGVSFGVDVFGAVSLVFRGNWAHEGKVLLLFDDMPLNDVMYGSLSLFDRYPIEQIDRVEVIRGAGSAKYGGNAQLAVMRVYSRSPEGFEVHLSGQDVAAAGFGGGGTAGIGGTFGDLSLSVMAHWSGGAYSGADWLDTDGTVLHLDDYSRVSYNNAIGKLDWRGFRARFFYDDQFSENPHNFGFGRDGETITFSSRDLLLSYDWAVSERVSLQPTYIGHRQHDWFIDRDPAVLAWPLDFFLPAGTDTYALGARIDLDEWDVLGGLQYSTEHARAESPGGVAPTPDVYFAGEPSVEYTTRSGFVQADWSRGPWTVSSGLRHNNHSFAGGSTVPRLSLVYARERWHVKAHLGRAFREPDIEVINTSDLGAGNIKPEETTQYEISAGWRPVPNVFGTVAVFQMEIEDPIVYTSAQALNSAYFYRNVDRVGTRGFETEWRAELGDVRLYAAYSYYESVKAPIEVYAVPGDEGSNVGAPRHKLTASANVSVPGTSWTLQPAFVWYDKTPAYVYTPGASGLYGNPLAMGEVSSRAYANVIARYRARGWEAGVGVYDAFDRGQIYPQPYRGESTPYPGPGRRLWAGLSLYW